MEFVNFIAAFVCAILNFNLTRCYSTYSPVGGRAIADWMLGSQSFGSYLPPRLQKVEFENYSTNGRKVQDLDQQPSSCQLVQIVHLIHQVGCQPKAIVSFACSGSCPSYVQMSSSKFWQHERSCSCCQQTGLQEATFTLDCPALNPPYKRVKTYAPVECMCRACTDLGKENLRPQELVEALIGDGVEKGK